MAFTKIDSVTLNSRGATTLDNKPTISATALKTEFDAPAKEVVAPAVNNLVDELEATTAAASLGATVPSGLPSGTATNVQSILTALDTAKVDKVSGKGLSTNDYDDDAKAIVDAVTDNLATKVDKVEGKGLSTNDYDATAKAIVDSTTENLANKVDKVSGKDLSTNDYDDASKAIVDGVTAELAKKVDVEAGKGLSTNDYDATAKAIVDSTTANLANKVDKVSGKDLSTNDFTDAYKGKLDGIEANANNYTLPTASTSTLGGVKVDGTTVTIDANGVISSPGGSGGSTVSWNQYVSSGTKIATIDIDGTATDVYAPTGGGGSATSYASLTDLPKVNGIEVNGNQVSSYYGLADASHTHTKSEITDFPTNVSSFTNDANYVVDASYTHIDVDTALSDTSTNPVQNKVISAKLSKQYVDGYLGRNIWNENWEQGGIDVDGTLVDSTTRIRSVDYITIPTDVTQLYFCHPYSGTRTVRVNFYDSSYTVTSSTYADSNSLLSIPSGATYLKFCTQSGASVSTYANNICINISDSLDGTYTAYSESNVSLTKSMSDITEKLSNSADWLKTKNLYLPYEYTRTVGGVTFGTNADGSISAVGTATTAVQSITASMFTENFSDKTITLASGTYTLSGQGANSYIELYTTESKLLANTSDGASTFTVSTDTNAFIRMRVGSGSTATLADDTVYPQLEEGSTESAYTSPNNLSNVALTKSISTITDEMSHWHKYNGSIEEYTVSDSTGSKTITFNDISDSKAYEPFFETADGSQVGITSSTYNSTANTLAYVVNVTVLPTSFRLKECNE